MHREEVTDTLPPTDCWVFSGGTDGETEAFGSKMLKATLGLSFCNFFVADLCNGVPTSSKIDIQQ